MAAVTVEGAVVEEKVDEEIPQEKVDIVAKKFDTEEPESAGGCDVCLPPNGLIGCGSYRCCTHFI